MDAHRHDLEIGTLLRRGAQQPRIPVKRRRNLSAVGERDNQVRRRELDRARRSPTSISKVLIPGCQQLVAMRSQATTSTMR
jgi:hypothetical protein